MVEGVERLPAKLAGEPFVEFNVLEERQVSSPEARAAHGTRTARANGGLRGIGIGEGAYVEPSAEGVRSAGVGIAYEIRAAANRRSTKKTTCSGRIDTATGTAEVPTTAVAQNRGQGKTGLESLDARQLPAAEDFARNALLRAQPRKFVDEVGCQDVTTIGNGWTVVVAKVAADLGNGRATGAAVGGISRQTVRPSVGNADEGISGEFLLHLRLERMIVRREEVHEE